ncbi:Glycosyltransferase involved in cell wall bisynthesis [Agreia bicolorata]|uniref:Glycosyltransferase involved in cell wall bisynthesis n=1 Tax=Agreia bicolorata TaxID=110935 RepID=A0A1T4XX20_9MICO|nr:glycosyltransferase family 1 protein [Agreia bicolorata]SKA93748.1 Glycosyltransferase involved in cell wall bisynthesis [Agreia bicolorata]
MKTSPRVLFDATSIPPNHGGVARFISGLLSGLEQNGEFVDVVAKRHDIPAFHDVAPGHNYLVAPALVSQRGGRFLWEQTGLPALARRRRADVIYSPHYTFPLVTRARRVVTLHDATFFSSPEAHSSLKGVFFRTWIRWANARADRLVAASRATADEVQRYVAHAQGTIDVGYLGVDPGVFAPPSPDAIVDARREIGLDPDQPWIAFLGTIEPRKNIPTLIAAHTRLREADPTTPVLVLSGARGWDEAANQALDLNARLAPEQRPVIEAGYLPLELLSAFLGASELVVYPSLGEGFGLPVLEAMSSGAAVLTTRRLSIPEVGGNAVAYAEPDADSLATEMRALLDSPDRRAELAAAGLARSSRFTWSECAAVYSRAFAAAGARS